MDRDKVINEYFDWLCRIVNEHRFGKEISYRKLLIFLHMTDFYWKISTDGNRAADGISLRWRFCCETDREELYGIVSEYLDGPCSVLEMMVALAIRCEENIMDNPQIGSRTGQWFWGMIRSLGLGNMSDKYFDKRYATDTIEVFLQRKYQPDGKGGLFTLRNSSRDLREVEIWRQLCWYLDEVG